jgi:HEXXH motif-containing protein
MSHALRQSLRQPFGAGSAAWPGLDAGPALAQEGLLEPLVFGAYFDLMASPEGAEAGSPAAQAWLGSRFSGLGSAAVPHEALADSAAPRISTLTLLHYSEQEMACWRRWLDTEPDNAMVLMGLDEASLQVEAEKILKALQFLARCAPELCAELTVLTRDILVARPGGGQLLDFRGASSFALWGAIAVNQQAHPHWWCYVSTLVHETAHSLLFARAREEPLVLNDPDARYLSPLRADARPMDGIFHAAFVSAREACALDQCLAFLGEQTDPESTSLAAIFEAELAGSVCAFWDCCDQISKYGQLSALGQRILDEARDFVSEHFTVLSQA